MQQPADEEWVSSGKAGQLEVWFATTNITTKNVLLGRRNNPRKPVTVNRKCFSTHVIGSSHLSDAPRPCKKCINCTNVYCAVVQYALYHRLHSEMTLAAVSYPVLNPILLVQFTELHSLQWPQMHYKPPAVESPCKESDRQNWCKSKQSSTEWKRSYRFRPMEKLTQKWYMVILSKPLARSTSNGFLSTIHSIQSDPS